MNRDETAAILAKVEPALGSSDVMPVETCICFGEKDLHAYDGKTALRFPTALGPRGGVRGKLLLEWLRSTKAPDVVFSQTDGTLTAKAGRARLEAPVLPETDFLFVLPDLSGALRIAPTPELHVALVGVCGSMCEDENGGWRFGVTLVRRKGRIRLYASDNKTVARAGCPADVDAPDLEALLPPRFVSLLLDRGKTDPPKRISVTPQWCAATFVSGLGLYHRAAAGADAKEFLKLFEGIDARKTKGAPVPDGLAAAAARATLAAGYSQDPFARLEAKDGKLTLFTPSPAGNVTDRLNFDHPPIAVRVLPALLAAGLERAQTVALEKDCVRFSAPGYSYLVATRQDAEA